MIKDVLIYKYFLGEFEVGRKYTSPLRSDDDTPSFCLYYDGDILKWKDFGYDSQGNRAINYLMEYLGLNYPEAIDFYTKNICNSTVNLEQIKVKVTPKPDKFIISTRNYFKAYELDYWNRFGITEELLISESIFPLESLKFNDNVVAYSQEQDPAFIYDLGKDAWKVYRPLASSYKWTSKNLENVLCEGINTLTAKKHEPIVITASTKDRLVLKQLGIQGVNPLSESNIYPLQKLNLNYDNIFIVFDNDSTGRKYANKLQSITGWKCIELKSECKDVAEAYERDFKSIKLLLDDISSGITLCNHS